MSRLGVGLYFIILQFDILRFDIQKEYRIPYVRDRI